MTTRFQDWMDVGLHVLEEELGHIGELGVHLVDRAVPGAWSPFGDKTILEHRMP